MSYKTVIDYESLVSAYCGNLTAVLRGFSAAEEFDFLNTWVPSEDHLQSVVEICESAREAEVPNLTVNIARETIATLDLARLEATLRTMGQLQARPDPTGAVSLDLSFGDDDSLSKVGNSYHTALAAASASRAHEGTLIPEIGAVLLQFPVDGLTVSAIVDPGTHSVKQIRYCGSCTTAERALMEELCAMVEGLPIQECSDHAAIKLENKLRDHTQSAPVAGLVTPENCDPVLGVAVRTMRSLLTTYGERTSYGLTPNTYVRPASHRWTCLSPDDRLQLVASAIDECFGTDGIVLLDLEGERRVIVGLSNGTSHGRQAGPQLLRLERHLQSAVEPVLEVHLKARADLNTIRKIKEVQK
jgi:hypothetical protein